MSRDVLFDLEGTDKREKDQETLNGKKISLFPCESSLPNNASVERYLGVVLDTHDVLERSESSFEPLLGVQKEEPVLKIVDKDQEIRALTFQKWKGVVKSISEKTFFALVTDSVEDVPEEEVELFFSDVQEDDKELLSVGAVFYWCMGYLYSSSNQATRVSFLRFQRLPSYNLNSIKMTAEKAQEIKDGITWM